VSRSDDEPIDWDVVFRLLARRCRMPPWDAARLTISQAVALLVDDAGRDPHAGNLPITNIDKLLELIDGEG
jgi:hypothetical protein